MALLDPKHLAAPFFNTVHIVSIIAVVLLFVVYRLATGNIEFEDTTAAMRAITRPGAVAPTTKNSVETNTAGISVAKEAPTVQESGKAPTSNDLSEIEKALGLSK